MTFEERQKEINKLQKEDGEIILQIEEALQEVTNSLIKDFNEEKHEEATKKLKELEDRHFKIQDSLMSLM